MSGENTLWSLDEWHGSIVASYPLASSYSTLYVNNAPNLYIGNGSQGWRQCSMSGILQYPYADPTDCPSGGVQYSRLDVVGITVAMAGITPSGNIIAFATDRYDISNTGQQCTPYPGVPITDPAWELEASGLQWAGTISPSLQDWFTDTSLINAGAAGTGSGYADGAKYIFTDGVLYQLYDAQSTRAPQPSNLRFAPVQIVATTGAGSVGTHVQGTYGSVAFDDRGLLWKTTQNPRDWSSSTIAVAIPPTSLPDGSGNAVAMTNPYGAIIVGLIWDTAGSNDIYAFRSFDGGYHWSIDPIPIAALPSSMDTPPKLVSCNRFVYAVWVDSSYNLQSVCSTDAGLTWR